MQVRNTQQKQLILSIMDGNKNHPTADEVYEAARKHDSHISRGTVYRNLNQLVEAKKILKILVPDSSDHFDSCVDDHYHFFCNKCEKVFDIPYKNKKVIDDFPKEMEKAGFVMESSNLIIMGRCPNCN